MGILDLVKGLDMGAMQQVIAQWQAQITQFGEAFKHLIKEQRSQKEQLDRIEAMLKQLQPDQEYVSTEQFLLTNGKSVNHE